jgi:hypothetical protein
MVALFDLRARRELIGGAAAKADSSTKAIGPLGQKAQFSGGQTQAYAHRAAYATTGAMSLVIVADIDSFNNYTAVIAKQKTTSTYCPYEFRFGATTDAPSLIRADNAGVGEGYNEPGSLGLTAPVRGLCLIVTADSGLRRPNTKWFTNGKKTTFAASGSTYCADDGVSDLIIGSRSDYFTGFNGGQYYIALFNRELTDPEALEINSKRFSVYEERRVYFPVSSAAPSLPTLSTATYVPGSITSTGFRPRVTAS